MAEIPSTTATGRIDGNDYVAKGTTKLRSGKVIGEAELRVPASAVDSTVVGPDAVQRLKEGLEQAVQALAQHDAKVNGNWPS